MYIWLEILIDVVISLVMIKVTSWLSRKSRVNFWQVGKSVVGGPDVIRGGWFSTKIVGLAKWITSTPD